MKNWWKEALIFLVILSVFTLSLNWKFVREIMTSPSELFSSDGIITEYIVETGYQKIIRGENPYLSTNHVFYPFTVNYSLNDPGMGILPYYVLLRPIMSIHQAILTILLIHLFLAGIFMYLLLMNIGVSFFGSSIMALSFTYTPFVTERLMGHYTYVTSFVFPLMALLVVRFVRAKRITQKLIYAVLFGLALGWTLQLNFYYFLMLLLGLGLAVGWYLFTQSKQMWSWILMNGKYVLIAGVISTISLVPWLIGVRESLLVGNREVIEGFGRAINYSVELKQFLIPSENNPTYYSFRKILGVGREWEKTVYPGLILLATVAYFILRNKKIPFKVKRQIKPFLCGASIFAVFTLGPFLKIGGSIELARLEGVSIVLPLPFLLFHYIPGLESMMVPGRFAPAYLFFLSIAGAYLVDYIMQVNKLNKWKMMIVLLAVVGLDQSYRLPAPVEQPVPVSLYREIGVDNRNSVVLEIPFAVRDGLKYLGFVHAISPMQGVLIHDKPILGGYFARVNDEIFEYYKGLKVLGYILAITDRGNYDPLYEMPKDVKIYPYPYTAEETKRELDFLRVRHILIKTGESYTEAAQKIVRLSGGEIVSSQDGYEHYVRELNQVKEKMISLGTEHNDYLSGAGGSVVGTKYRTVVMPEAKLFFTGNGRSGNLVLEMSSTKKRMVEIYLNDHYVRSAWVMEREEYSIPNVSMKEGVNTIMLKIKTLEKDENLDEESGIRIYTIGERSPD